MLKYPRTKRGVSNSTIVKQLGPPVCRSLKYPVLNFSKLRVSNILHETQLMNKELLASPSINSSKQTCKIHQAVPILGGCKLRSKK